MAKWSELLVQYRILFIFIATIVLGVSLGFIAPPSSDQYPQPWATISGIVGWTYFSAWSISFWPQIFINYSRKSVVGLSFDYVYLNILGFSAYSCYNLAYYYNSRIRADYATVYGGFPGVQSNDVFFALHAVCCTVIVGVQCAVYEGAGQRMSLMSRALLTLGTLFSIIYACVAAAYDGKVEAADHRSWLSFLTALSYVKLGITLSKYSPQVYLNWKRKSTEGWSVENVLLDFTGGALSVLQLVGDARSINNWGLLTGDPVKLGLGNVSMAYDLVFVIQHFVLYRQGREGAEGKEKGAYQPITGADEA